VRAKLAALVLAAGAGILAAWIARADDTGTQAVPIFDIPAHLGIDVAPIPRNHGRGTLILEGGGLGVDEATRQIVAYAGPDPVLCLIDSASDGTSAPEERFEPIGNLRMLVLDITPGNAGDKAILDALNSCGGFYFDGGDPGMLSRSLLDGTKDRPALAVIRGKFEHDGAVISGTSAGAMIAGPITLCECGPTSSVHALGEGKLFQAPGFHFIDGLLIDAHFFARGLIGRHLYALATTGEAMGVGIDEATAVVVPGDGGPWSIEGASKIALIYRSADTTAGRLDNFTFDLLSSGDRFDPFRRHIAIAADRRPWPLGRGGDADPLITDDIFSPLKARDFLLSFITAKTDRAEGRNADTGLAIEFAKGPDSAAYGVGQQLSVLGLSVGVASY
jgi:cyanophycinase